MFLDDGSFKGPIDKFLTDEEREELIEKAGLKMVQFYSLLQISMNLLLVRKLDLLERF